MKRRMFAWSGGSLCLALGVAFLIPSSRYSMLGYLRDEKFDEGRPKSYWIDALRDPRPEVREEAEACLAHMGPQAADAVPALTALLHDEKAEVRWKAAFALYKIRAESGAAVQPLCDGLKDSHPAVRLYCSMCLSGVGPEAYSAIPALIEAVKDRSNAIHLFPSNINTRQLAIVALGHIGPGAQEAVPFLIESLADEDPIVREVAIKALGNIRSRDSIPSLLAILEDESSPRRLDAAGALGGIGSEASAALPTLRKMMKSPNWQVSRAASVAARQIDPTVDTSSVAKRAAGVP
jgi:HEAT repeat protein